MTSNSIHYLTSSRRVCSGSVAGFTCRISAGGTVKEVLVAGVINVLSISVLKANVQCVCFLNTYITLVAC